MPQQSNGTLILPPYTPPDVPASQTPPSPTRTDWSVSVDTAPVGVELIVRCLVPFEGHGSMVEYIRAAVKSVHDNGDATLDFPVDVAPGRTRGPPPPYCYLRLAPAVTRVDDKPRPDLLNKYKEPLAAALGRDKWEVAWSPAHEKDKKFWLRVRCEPGCDPKRVDEFIEQVRAACKEAGAPTSSAFALGSQSKSATAEPVSTIAVVAYSSAGKEKLLKASLSVQDITLTASDWLQIDPIWPFELVITGLGGLDYTITSTIEKYFIDNYCRDGRTLFHSSRHVSSDYLCILMTDWAATAAVLKSPEDFTRVFGALGLSPPALVHTLNTTGMWKRRDNAESAIRSGTAAVDQAMQGVRAEIAQMRREMQTGYNHLSARMGSVEENVKGISDNVRELTGMVYHNSQLLMAQEKAQALVNSLGLRLVQLERRMDSAETAEEKEELKMELREKRVQLAKAEDELERIQDSTRTLRGLPAPASSDIPLTPPGLPAPTRRSASPGGMLRTPTSSPAKRSSSARDEPPHLVDRRPPPPRRADDTAMSEDKEFEHVERELGAEPQNASRNAQ